MIVDYYNCSGSDEDLAIYDRIKSWCPDDFPPVEFLPKLGVIVWDEETQEMICFLCADMSNSIPRAFIDHLQTNPAFPITKRYKAVRMAEDFLCERLRENGYAVIIGASPHAGVASLSQSMGYQVSGRALAGFTKYL